MISTPIYKRDTAGKIRTWQYEVEDDQYRTVAGVKDGNLVTTGWTVCKPKNEGRANATTAAEQAASEAAADEGKKLKREYRRTIAELDAVVAGPMLAKSYDKLKKPVVFPVFSQPKLDGIRAIINKNGALSREGQPHGNCDHIIEALAPVFAKYPDITLDGEFYHHELRDDFNKIVSVVRKQKPTPEERAESARLCQYHVYDLPSEESFTQRTAELWRIFRSVGITSDEHPMGNGPVRFVVTNLASDQERLDEYYGLIMAKGYEGQMVRLNAPYDFDTRSASLLKRKEFKTAEFPVLRIEEGLGNWAGYAKRIVIQLPNGQECGAGMRGNQDFAKKLLARTDIKSSTIRFFGETPDGQLRFPVAIDFQGAEGRVD